MGASSMVTCFLGEGGREGEGEGGREGEGERERERERGGGRGEIMNDA